MEIIDLYYELIWCDQFQKFVVFIIIIITMNRLVKQSMSLVGWPINSGSKQIFHVHTNISNSSSSVLLFVAAETKILASEHCSMENEVLNIYVLMSTLTCFPPKKNTTTRNAAYYYSSSFDMIRCVIYSIFALLLC